MTKERYAIAWEGKLGVFVGRVYNYTRGQELFTPATHPMLWPNLAQLTSSDNAPS